MFDKSKASNKELGQKTTELLRNLNEAQQDLLIASMTDKGLRITVKQLLEDFYTVSEAFNDLCDTIDTKDLWNEVNDHREARELTKEL